MREILFKGFFEYDGGKESIRVNGEIVTGEWAVGLLTSVESNVSTSRISPITFNESGEIVYLSQNSWAHDDVIPETVCEYTGLKDSNGNKVFEGDRIKAYEADEENEYEIVYKGSDDYPAFDCKPYIECESNGLSWLKGADYKFEVIGTIFDVKEEEK